MAADVVEKENVREYANKAIDKQKNNSKYDDNRGNKKGKNRIPKMLKMHYQRIAILFLSIFKLTPYIPFTDVSSYLARSVLISKNICTI